ncbi:MAG: LysR family transcriptional regulator, partial [Gemmatimonadaceae bacterium]|nr:LysR family transcriptional regulator [Acetobacteraceae bacterium]
MLDQVTGMRVFVRVAAAGSLAAAGRAIALSQTMVTKHVDALEARLGVRLLHRSTRRLTLTEAGRTYLDACQRILAEIEEADQAASAGQAEPRGTLRMNVPVSFGTFQVAPLLQAFTARHPKVSLDMGFNDRL